MKMKLKTDDVLKDLTTYEDYEFNTILCDPPYNLGTEWMIDKDGSFQVKGKPQDFMSKWSALDGPALDTFFKESFRVMKYGGYMLMFALDRQIGPLMYYAVKNGWEINQSLYWYFVSNFPKATDASKMLKKRIDKKGGDEKLVEVFDGYKYSKAPLKQMLETIIVFSKPTKNKSVLDDIMEWSEDVDLLNYCPKVGKKERNMGCDDLEEKTISRMATAGGTSNIPSKGMERFESSGKNTHPTLKPINLIYEIAKLFKLPDIVGQKVYVPFSGSGSEVIGLLKAGYDHNNIVACEMNPEYVEISKKRIKHFYDAD